MKSFLLIFLLIGTLFTACTPTSDTTDTESSSHDYDDDDHDDDSTYTSPTDPSSSDTETINTSYSVHNQGVACATCHASGEETFDSGATIFYTINAENYDGSRAASGYKIKLILDNGDTISYYTARGTGNVYKGWINAGVGQYTAQVLDPNGVVVNSSLTNSHDASRYNCNSCHTASGNNGAPGRIVSYNYAAATTTTNTTTTPTTTTVTNPMFDTDILPILQAKCEACHGNSGSFTITNVATPYDGVVPFIDTTSAESSALLLKGSAQVSHLGGEVIAITSTEYITIRDWIAAAAPYSASSTTTTTTTTTTTPTQVSFQNDVLPLLQSSCQACHGSSGSFSITNAATPYEGVVPFINTADAVSSNLLLKATNQTAHGGGTIYSTTSTQYATIRDWISQGALNN